MGSQTDSQVDGSTTEVPKKAAHPHLRKTTCVDLHWVAKTLKTCVLLRANLVSLKVDASHPKSAQAPAKQSRKLPQVLNLRVCLTRA